MDVTISSRGVELTDALRQAAEEKIGRLDRFLDGMERAEVHFVEERNPRIAAKDVCEVTMEGHGHHVRAKVAAADPFAAVDAAAEKLEHQLHKLKTKLVGRSHPRRRDEARAERIVKEKRFAMAPMTPEEAAEQLDLLGHDFYFFANAETGRAAVLYRRQEGDFGLIDDAT